MYYEEKMINGVMCWRADKNSGFVPYDLKELSERYERLKEDMRYIRTSIRPLAKAILAEVGE